MYFTNRWNPKRVREDMRILMMKVYLHPLQGFRTEALIPNEIKCHNQDIYLFFSLISFPKEGEGFQMDGSYEGKLNAEIHLQWFLKVLSITN